MLGTYGGGYSGYGGFDGRSFSDSAARLRHFGNDVGYVRDGALVITRNCHDHEYDTEENKQVIPERKLRGILGNVYDFADILKKRRESCQRIHVARGER